MNITSVERVIPFWSLRVELSKRSPKETGTVPIDAIDINRKSKYFGREVSSGSVNRFLRGESNPEGPTFEVIKATIQNLADITIDFTDSPYSKGF